MNLGGQRGNSPNLGRSREREPRSSDLRAGDRPGPSVYALGSTRWGDPRANLLDGPAWEQARPQVLTALRLTDPVTAHLSDLAGRLDAAHLGLAARLGPAIRISFLSSWFPATGRPHSRGRRQY
jgi:hypothetical protein